MGLPRAVRLSRGDLRAVSGGIRVRQASGPVSVQFFRPPDGQGSDGAVGGVRVGFAVGRPVGGAVVRNRVRRRLREILRPLLSQLSGAAPSGVTLVVVRVSPGTGEVSAAELGLHVERAMTRGLDRVSRVASGAGS